MTPKSKALDKKYRELGTLEEKICVKKRMLDRICELSPGDTKEFERQLADMEDRAALLKKEMIADFSLVTDEKLLSVLSGIYLEHKDWIEVAKEIKYTVRYAMMLRDKGLSQITREK